MTLSSNWKALQTSLRHGVSDGNTTTTTPAVTKKRKRTTVADSSTSRGRSKRLPHVKRSKLNRMGLAASSSATDADSPSSLQTNDHNVNKRAQDLGPDSESGSAETQLPPTTKNMGHHPTHKPGKFLSLDCEFVGTGPPESQIHMLARVSIVNYHSQLIYDSFVIPSAPVTDYRTHVSGVRAHDLLPSSGARPFQTVRAAVLELLSPPSPSSPRILVGHALRGDLQVLDLEGMIPRARIRDTARYSGYRTLSNGKTPALKLLAEKVLGKEIQSGEHDSIVDSATAMELFRRERVGIESEVRRRFGGHAATVGEKGKVGRGGAEGGRLGERREGMGDLSDEDLNEDEDEDGSGSQFESGSDAEAAPGRAAQTPKRQKTKKKKKKSRRR